MTFLQESTDSFTDTYESIRKEVRKLQKRVEKQTRTPLRRLRGNVLVKRTQNLGSDARKQIAGGVETVLGHLQIASKSDLERIERKLKQIDLKLQGVENRRETRKSNGPARSTVTRVRASRSTS